MSEDQVSQCLQSAFSGLQSSREPSHPRVHTFAKHGLLKSRLVNLIFLITIFSSEASVKKIVSREKFMRSKSISFQGNMLEIELKGKLNMVQKNQDLE